MPDITGQDDYSASPFLQGLLNDYSKSIVPASPAPVVPMSAWSRMPASVQPPISNNPQKITPAQAAPFIQKKPVAPPVVQTTSENQIADPNRVRGVLNALENSPGIEDQANATKDLQNTMQQNLLDQLASSSSVAQPLLRLGDAFNHTNVAQGYTGQTPKDISNQLLAYQNAIAQQKQNTAKDLIQGMAAILKDKTGQTTVKIGNDTGGFSGIANARDRQAAISASQNIDQDKILQQSQSAVNNIDRALEILNGSAPITATSFNILGNDMANALAPGGVATEGKINRELPAFIQKSINDLQQHFGTLKDLRSSPGATQQLVQLQNLLAQAKQQYSQAANERLDEKEAPLRAIPTQVMQDMLDNKIPILRQKFANQAAQPSINYQPSTGQQLLALIGRGKTYSDILKNQAPATAPTPAPQAGDMKSAADQEIARRKAAKGQ